MNEHSRLFPEDNVQIEHGISKECPLRIRVNTRLMDQYAAEDVFRTEGYRPEAQNVVFPSTQRAAEYLMRRIPLKGKAKLLFAANIRHWRNFDDPRAERARKAIEKAEGSKKEARRVVSKGAV